MEVFWREGFHGASIAQLGAAMGLRPGSIYAAFGSKEGLFREALAAYTRQVRARARALQLGPRALLERWFTLHIDRALAEAGG
ncbi:MAG: helix-turn-helix transcriptional regulator, partial [Myxococcales bacterium]|nr:helix-turn-helix transcriptional regulator [Myxococcales bacterium]